jgi:hypothetical protein
VAVHVGDFARHDKLDAREERIGDARLAGIAGVLKHEHAALGLFCGDHFTRLEHQSLDVRKLP